MFSNGYQKIQEEIQLENMQQPVTLPKIKVENDSRERTQYVYHCKSPSADAPINCQR